MSALASRAIPWVFAPFAVAYVGATTVRFGELVRGLYWDSDAASPLVLAELLRGEGTVTIPHFGWWTSLWGLLATRELPRHEELWEATGFAFAIAGAAILGLTVWRLAGRWAGAAAAAGALAIGPDAFRSLLTVNFHVSTPFVVVVLGAYVVALARGQTSVALAAGVGLLAGTSAASDPLLWVAGVAPLATACVALIVQRRRAHLLAPTLVVLAVTAVSAAVTDWLMRTLGFEIVSAGVAAAAAEDLDHNALKLAKTIAVLGGANFLYRPTYPSDPLRFVIAAITLVAVAAAVLAAARLVSRNGDPCRVAYGWYAGMAVVFLCFAFVGTNQGEAVFGAGGVNYVLTLAPATAALIAIVAAPSRAGRFVVAAAIATLAASNTAQILQEPRPTPARARHAPELMAFLERSAITRGYAAYWNAQSLTWQSRMKLFVAPVSQCDLPRSGTLCPFRLFTIESWFRERSGRSFLIVDRETQYVTEARPPPEASPYATRRVGTLTVYLFDHDIARHLRQ